MKYNKNIQNEVFQEKIFKNLQKWRCCEYFPPILKNKKKEKKGKYNIKYKWWWIIVFFGDELTTFGNKNQASWVVKKDIGSTQKGHF